MPERKPISKKMRFDVFKRDSFTCQYCGKQSPDVILHVDHIKPVSKGGKNTLLNLVTSCSDCNLGKSDRELSDDSAVKKQQKQLQDLAEKNAQIEMMVNWRESLLEADEKLTDSAVNLINKYLAEWRLMESGIAMVRKAVKKKGYQAVMDAIENCYLSCDDNKQFKAKYQKAIEFAGASRKPSISYAKGILRNRGIYISDIAFYSEFNSDPLSGEEIQSLIERAKSCNSIDDFRNAYNEVVHG